MYKRKKTWKKEVFAKIGKVINNLYIFSKINYAILYYVSCIFQYILKVSWQIIISSYHFNEIFRYAWFKNFNIGKSNKIKLLLFVITLIFFRFWFPANREYFLYETRL